MNSVGTPYHNVESTRRPLSRSSKFLAAVVAACVVLGTVLLMTGGASDAAPANTQRKSFDPVLLDVDTPTLKTRPARKEEQKEEAEEAKEEAEEEAKEHAEEKKEDEEKAREKAEDKKEKEEDKKEKAKERHHEDATEALPYVGSSTCMDASGKHGPCMPGVEFCGDPFANAPMFHLMDQHGCSENDPNGPVFDPVHGVVHHFYQIHLSAAPGHGPDYGHFVSKDFVTWAALPVAIWNGYDSSVDPPRVTPYDNEAIFTGSAVVVDGAGPGGVPGVVNIYPGLCNKNDWANCSTGTLLAQAVPADYVNDQLLVNWTKPSYNPIIEDTQRDPTTPWKTASGEWQLRDYTGTVYGSASDADMLAGKWYKIGKGPNMRQCECPSFYPLPGPSPGSEDVYHKHLRAGTLPNHVHKTSCGGDWWQIGSYDSPTQSHTLGSFKATPGWEDVFAQKRIDQGQFYASKDNLYPTKTKGVSRRINWGWAQVKPASAQTLPREITFNAAARTLQQYPIQELEALRGPAAVSYTNLPISVVPGTTTTVNLGVPKGVAKQSEVLLSIDLAPGKAFNVAVAMGSVTCTINVPQMNASAAITMVPVSCGGVHDKVPMLATEKSFEIRMFADWTFLEVFFQQGRSAMVVTSTLDDNTDVTINTDAPIFAQVQGVYPMKSIWVDPDTVRKQDRVYS